MPPSPSRSPDREIMRRWRYDSLPSHLNAVSNLLPPEPTVSVIGANYDTAIEFSGPKSHLVSAAHRLFGGSGRLEQIRFDGNAAGLARRCLRGRTRATWLARHLGRIAVQSSQWRSLPGRGKRTPLCEIGLLWRGVLAVLCASPDRGRQRISSYALTCVGRSALARVGAFWLWPLHRSRLL